LQESLGGYKWEILEETEHYTVVGTTKCRFSSAGRKEEKETTTKEKTEIDGLANWHSADRSNRAAETSFNNQAAKRIAGVPPDPAKLDAARERIYQDYPRSKRPQGFCKEEYGEGEWFSEEIIRSRCHWIIEHDLPKDSKPGVPYSILGTNNRDIVIQDPEMIIDLVVERLRLIGTIDADLYGPVELVRMNACDPVRVFVKGEPHSTKKVEQGRWRLIFAVSIVDQIIERLLCSSQNREEIRLWDKCPSAPGLSLSSDLSLKQLYDIVMELKGEGKMAEADVTGWDWSVKEWELLEDAVMRAHLGNFTKMSAKALFNRQVCASRTVYAMPDGKLRTLTGDGVLISGCYNTSSTNSRLRVLVAYLVGALWAKAMGDDCVEDFVTNATEKYAAIGHPLKMYVEKDDEFEFCSLIHTQEGAWPVDGTKTLFRLIEQKCITEELKAQFRLEMRNSPRLDEFLSCVERVSTAGGQDNLNKDLHAERQNKQEGAQAPPHEAETPSGYFQEY
jgi:hypothetical protein